ncbi:MULTISPECIES: hypothetical protein [Pseudomonas]|uniref:hypothetical protein n=1 Tax=Pseudomonas TaxID=286 RepID=UPI001054E4E9|nr:MULTISPECIES: hypothetical protein [Pseudomonas]WNZ87356.1 hypothetical protein QOM10_30870 [Pseudomonas sp. P108]
MLDSLGAQRYTEQQMLYMRKAKNLEHDLDVLEERRKALETSIGMSQVEAGAGNLKASDSEAVRMGDYATATHDAQTRIAKESSEQAVKQALIENDRDRELMEAELDTNRRLVELDQKYSSSIQSTSSATEKARLKSELEVEKAKAEAQRKKALIEADSTRDLSRLEQDFQVRIISAKRDAAANNQAADQVSQSQRIKIALANADSKRRVQADIGTAQDAITLLKTELHGASQPLLDEIGKLNERISSLQGQLVAVQAGYDAKIAVQQSRLDGLQVQNNALADVERDLINAPVASTNASGHASSLEVDRLQGDLQQAKRDIQVRKSRQLADVDQQLSQELAGLSVNLTAALGTALSSGTEANARLEKVVNETAIRSELAAKKTQINNDARSQLAELTVKTEIAKASVVGPVLTNRAVYSGSYGEQPVAFAVKESNAAKAIVAKAKPHTAPVAVAEAGSASEVNKPPINNHIAPLVVVSDFAPKAPRPRPSSVDDVVIASGVMAGGDMKPLVVAPAATSYSVIYTYGEKGSADKFSNFLKAYGINDFTYRYSEKLKQHVLFMGKFTSKDQAASRVAFLNKTTSSANAKIIETDL